MKNLVFLISFISLNIFSQSKYITKTGVVNFEASVPSFEEVSAKNNATTAILNTDNGEFAALVLVKGFRFKNALMEEHFNENYAESDKFPKATFKGIILDLNLGLLGSKTNLIMKGELSFHGKIKSLNNIPITLTKENGIIKMTGKLTVKTSDFDIKIPKIVKTKVSESVNITFVFDLKS